LWSILAFLIASGSLEPDWKVLQSPSLIRYITISVGKKVLKNQDLSYQAPQAAESCNWLKDLLIQRESAGRDFHRIADVPVNWFLSHLTPYFTELLIEPPNAIFQLPWAG